MPFEECDQRFKVDCTVTCKCCSSCFGLFSTYIEYAFVPPSSLNLVFSTSDPQTLELSYVTIINSATQTIVEEFDVKTFYKQNYIVSISTTDCYQIISRGLTANGKSLLQEVYINNVLLTSGYGNDDGFYNQSIGYSSSINATVIDSCDNFLICGVMLTPNNPIRRLVNVVTRFTRLPDIVGYRQEAMCWWIKDLQNTVTEDDLDDTKVQRYLLALLYFSTDGDNWSNNKNWLGKESVCFWYGITCVSSAVTEINLALNELKATIPSELGQFQFLKALSLYHNSLSGSFPIGLANAINLETMDLSSNDFVGRISSNIKQLQELKFVDLSFNLFSSSIPTEVGMLSSLELLKVNSNSFSSELPTDLIHLKNIKTLDLADNFLGGEVVYLERLDNLGKQKWVIMFFPTKIDLINLSVEYLNLSRNYFAGYLPISGRENMRVLGKRSREKQYFID